MFRRVLFSVLLASAITQFARGDSPKVTTVLSNSEATVGHMVQMEIKVTGARSAEAPEEIAADGLEIRRTDQRQESYFSFGTGKNENSSSVTYVYTVLPLKAGTFKIPPQSIRAGKDNLQTPELTLQVAASPRAAAGAGTNRVPSGNALASGNEKIAFAEIVVPKKTAYVGEIIPIVVRIGFNSRSGLAQQPEPPQISGQGFTVEKLVPSQPMSETIEGRRYFIFTYKTAISAARAGKFEIGPAETKGVILVSKRNSGAGRKPFDPFGSNDVFSDPFFRDPFGMLSEPREVSVKSDPVSLEVKALPAGAPPTFSGAVGSFSMTAEAKPKRVQIGDPITIKAAISGRGNFDRMNAPELSDERGWHKYPPSSNFKQDDDVGISGTKTFELVVSPNEKLTNVPPLTFGYFDPVKEKYVTLQSEAVPLIVEGNTPAAPAIAGTTPATSTSPAPGGQQKAQDVLPQIKDRGKIVSSFGPVYARKEFWLAQLFPLTLALGLVGWKVQNVRASNRAPLRAAQLQRERDELLRKLRRDQLAPREYFSDASRVVQLKTALKQTTIEPATVDADTAARVFDLNAEQSERMRRLFATSDEFRYSGAGNGDSALSGDRRRQTLELIESLS